MSPPQTNLFDVVEADEDAISSLRQDDQLLGKLLLRDGQTARLTIHFVRSSRQDFSVNFRNIITVY